MRPLPFRDGAAPERGVPGAVVAPPLGASDPAAGKMADGAADALERAGLARGAGKLGPAEGATRPAGAAEGAAGGAVPGVAGVIPVFGCTGVVCATAGAPSAINASVSPTTGTDARDPLT